MKKNGKSNPLLSLVEFSTTFDPETLQTVITKLKEIRMTVANSAIDDAADEQTSVARFNSLLSGLNTQLKGYTDEQTALEKEKKTKEGLRDDAESTYNTEDQNYNERKEMKEAKEAALAAELAAHQTRMLKMYIFSYKSQ